MKALVLDMIHGSNLCYEEGSFRACPDDLGRLLQLTWDVVVVVSHGERGHFVLSDVIICSLEGAYETNELNSLPAPGGCTEQKCKRVDKNTVIRLKDINTRIFCGFTCHGYSKNSPHLTNVDTLKCIKNHNAIRGFISAEDSHVFYPGEAEFIARMLIAGACVQEVAARMNRVRGMRGALETIKFYGNYRLESFDGSVCKEELFEVYVAKYGAYSLKSRNNLLEMYDLIDKPIRMFTKYGSLVAGAQSNEVLVRLHELISTQGEITQQLGCCHVSVTPEYKLRSYRYKINKTAEVFRAMLFSRIIDSNIFSHFIMKMGCCDQSKIDVNSKFKCFCCNANLYSWVVKDFDGSAALMSSCANCGPHSYLSSGPVFSEFEACLLNVEHGKSKLVLAGVVGKKRGRPLIIHGVLKDKSKNNEPVTFYCDIPSKSNLLKFEHKIDVQYAYDLHTLNLVVLDGWDINVYRVRVKYENV